MNAEGLCRAEVGLLQRRYVGKYEDQLRRLPPRPLRLQVVDLTWTNVADQRDSQRRYRLAVLGAPSFLQILTAQAFGNSRSRPLRSLLMKRNLQDQRSRVSSSAQVCSRGEVVLADSICRGSRQWPRKEWKRCCEARQDGLWADWY